MAASTVVQRSHAWCQIRGRPGLIWGEGGRAHLSPHACEKGHSRLRLRHRWDRAPETAPDAQISESVGCLLGPAPAVWWPSARCPIGTSLPRHPTGIRGTARALHTLLTR